MQDNAQLIHANLTHTLRRAAAICPKCELPKLFREQEVGSSNLPAPTRTFNKLATCSRTVCFTRSAPRQQPGSAAVM